MSFKEENCCIPGNNGMAANVEILSRVEILKLQPKMSTEVFY